jgi:hypothetical protein
VKIFGPSKHSKRLGLASDQPVRLKEKKTAHEVNVARGEISTGFKHTGLKGS